MKRPKFLSKRLRITCLDWIDDDLSSSNIGVACSERAKSFSNNFDKLLLNFFWNRECRKLQITLNLLQLPTRITAGHWQNTAAYCGVVCRWQCCPFHHSFDTFNTKGVDVFAFCYACREVYGTQIFALTSVVCRLFSSWHCAAHPMKRL